MTKSTQKLALAVAAGALVTVTSVMAVSGTPAPEATPAAAEASTQASVQLSAEQVEMQKAAILAAAGRSTVQYIGAAQKALAAGETEPAAQLLEVARDTLTRIGGALEGDGVDPAAVVLPLYARVGVMEEVEFTPQQVQQLNEIGPLVAAGKHDEVAASLGTIGVAMAYSYVEMPLGATTTAVNEAVKALQDGDVETATARLSAVDDALVSEDITIGAAGTEPAPPAAAGAAAAAAAGQG